MGTTTWVVLSALQLALTAPEAGELLAPPLQLELGLGAGAWLLPGRGDRWPDPGGGLEAGVRFGALTLAIGADLHGVDRWSRPSSEPTFDGTRAEVWSVHGLVRGRLGHPAALGPWAELGAGWASAEVTRERGGRHGAAGPLARAGAGVEVPLSRALALRLGVAARLTWMTVPDGQPGFDASGAEVKAALAGRLDLGVSRPARGRDRPPERAAAGPAAPPPRHVLLLRGGLDLPTTMNAAHYDEGPGLEAGLRWRPSPRLGLELWTGAAWLESGDDRGRQVSVRQHTLMATARAFLPAGPLEWSLALGLGGSLAVAETRPSGVSGLPPASPRDLAPSLQLDAGLSTALAGPVRIGLLAGWRTAPHVIEPYRTRLDVVTLRAALELGL